MPPERRKGSQIPPPSGLGMRPKSLIPKPGAHSSGSGIDFGNGIVHVDETSKTPSEKTPSPVDSELFSKWNEWIGQRVCVGGAKRGVLRFFGPVEFQIGIWCGVELFEPVGKNDGSVKGIRYFSCEDNYGIFAPIKKVEKICLPHNLPDSGTLREPEQTVDSVQAKSKLPAPKVLSKFPLQTGKFYPPKDVDAENRLDDHRRKIPPPKTFFYKENKTSVKSQCENINVTQTIESEAFHLEDCQVDENDKTYGGDDFVQGSIDNEVFQRGSLNVSYTVDTEGNSSNGYQVKQDPNLTFHMTNTPVDITFVQEERKDEHNITFDSTSTNQPTEKLNSTFDLEYTPCLNSVNTQESPPFPTSEGNEANTTFNLEEQPHITEYLMRRPGEFLNQIEGHNLDYISEGDDEYDDGLSLDFEDSLGILTPNQMKDFTLYSEHHSLIAELDAVMLPKTFSCDEMNELPESEMVEDVTVEYRDTSSQDTQHNTCSTAEDANTLTQESKNSLSTDKIMTRDPQGSLECLPELTDDKSDSVNYFAEDAIHTSTPSSLYEKSSTRNLLLQSVEYGLENSLSQHLNEEVSTPPGQADSLGKLPIKILENEYFKDGVCKEQDVSRVEDQELPSLTLIQESYSSVGGLIENTLVIASARPSRVSEDIMNEGRLLDSLNLKQLDSDKSDTCDKPVTCNQEISNHTERSNEMTNSKVFVPVNEDQVFSRETSFDSKERPLSTYTVCSADTGFQGDLDLEVGEEYNMRFSTYSEDSGTVSLGPEIEQQLRSRNEMYFEEMITEEESKQLGSQQYGVTRESPDKIQDDIKWEGKITNESKEMLRCQENGDIFSITAFTNEVKMEDSLSPVIIRTSSFVIDTTSTEVSSSTIPANHPITDGSVKDQIKDKTPDNKIKQEKKTNKDESLSLTDKSGKHTVMEEPKKKPKTPKKNVMSKIKAMIESTSVKKNKTETTEGETKKTPKKSRWDAVTSKIKASLDEEKSKPKTKKEIKSRIDTNLALARQPQEKKSFTTKPDTSVNEGNSISGRQSKLSKKSRNASKSQRSQEQICVSPIIMDSLYSHEDNNLSSISRSSTLNFTSSLSEALPSNYISVNSENLKNSLTTKSAMSPTLSVSPAPPSEMSTASLASHDSRSQSQVAVQKKNLASKTGPKSTKTTTASAPISVSSKQSTGKSQPPAHKQTLVKKEPVKKAAISSTKQPLLMPVSSTKKKLSHPVQAVSAKNISSSKQIPLQRRESNQGQTKVRSSLAPSVTGERRKTQGEYLLEIQRLGALCETRTKELNWLKLQLKHTTLGFDSFTVLIKYLTDDLDAFSNPRLANEVEKSREDLRKTETQLNQYQEEVETLKKCHAEELGIVREELDLVRKDELARLVLKHEKEVEDLRNEYKEKVVGLTETHAKASKEVQEKHSAEIETLKQQHHKLLEELEKDYTVRLKDVEQSHKVMIMSLKEQNDKFHQQLEELEQEKQSIEETLKQDTDSKIQLIMKQKTELKKEVESLKTVLEMKKSEIQNLRTENLKMQKDLEELPLAKEQVEKLKARNEDLQARVDEKVELERQLSCEQVKLRESYEKESKVNKRLSMEKEELVWKLKQTMEASILLGSPTGDTPAIDRLDQLAKDYTLRKSPIRMSVFFDNLDGNSSYYKHSSPGQKSGQHLTSPRTRILRQGSNSSPSTPNKKRRPRSLENESVEKSPERKVSAMADIKICLEYNEDEHRDITQQDNNQDLSETVPNGDVELTPTEETAGVILQAAVDKEESSVKLLENDHVASETHTATSVLSENCDLATDGLREQFTQETAESPKTTTDVQKTTTILLCSGDSSSSTSSNVEQYDIVKQVHIRTKPIDQPSGAGEQLATTLVSAGVPEVDGSWQSSMTSSGSSWSMGLDVGDNKEIGVEEQAEKVNDFNGSSEDRSDSSSEQDEYPIAPRCLAGEAMIQEECPRSISESSSEGSPVSKHPCQKDKKDSSVKLVDGTVESSDGLFTLDDSEHGPLLENTVVDVNWCDDDDLPSETEV